MTNHILDFFNAISTEADLEDLVASGHEEDLYLEFKQKEDSRNGSLGNVDKKNFSKALSSFANADGGILIFGIKTEKIEGIDKAASLKPITDHSLFRSRLLDSIISTTQPTIDGVIIQSIDSKNEGLGYVKCYIPKSFKPPHRAMLADQHYWIRNTNATRKMDHYELEDIFGRRLRPSLSIILSLNTNPLKDKWILTFSLINEGRGIARHSGFIAHVENAKIFDARPPIRNISVYNPGRETLSFQDDTSVIHANGIQTNIGKVHLSPKESDTAIIINITWCAENMETRQSQQWMLPGAAITLK